MMKKSTSHLKWCAVLGVLLLAASAGAAVIWSDDFEGADKWDNKWTGGTGTAGLVANPDGSGNVFHIKSDTTADYAAARSQDIGTTLNQSTEFHVEFDVYFPVASTQATFHVFSGETDAIGPDLVFRWTENHPPDGDYTFDHRDDVDYHELTTSTIAATTWTKVLIDAAGDGNYDVHVGSYANNIGTFDLKNGDWNNIYLGEGSTSSYSGEMYVDNYVITDTAIPEPGTMSLVLGFSGLILLCRRFFRI